MILLLCGLQAPCSHRQNALECTHAGAHATPKPMPREALKPQINNGSIGPSFIPLCTPISLVHQKDSLHGLRPNTP